MLIAERKHRLPPEEYRGFVTVAYTCCVLDRREPFREAFITRLFQDKLRTSAQKFGCEIVVSCFMPDHVHLILEGAIPSADTWKAMVNFKQATGFWFGQQGRIYEWQKDFYDHVIHRDDNLDRQIQYILDNPVRKGLVERWEDYPWIEVKWRRSDEAGGESK